VKAQSKENIATTTKESLSAIRLSSAFLSGILFAIGLGLSGMTQPQRIIQFLDIFGNWDPSLILVMMGAISLHFLIYRLVRNWSMPLANSEWHVPKNRQITGQLIAGSAIFGIGWGIAGFCPGPALASIASGTVKPFLFIVSMCTGMLFYQLLKKHIQWFK
jgi:uncharacterized membrane protein YedE/YeeE